MSHTLNKERIQSLVKQLETACILYDMPFVCCVQTDKEGDNVLHAVAAYMETGEPISETVCAMYDELEKLL